MLVRLWSARPGGEVRPALGRWRCAVISVFWLFVGSLPLAAQFGPSTSPDPQLPVVKPEMPEFAQATEKLREHLKSLRATIVKYNTSESPAEGRKWKERWYELLPAGHALHQDMVRGVLAEYKAAPDEKRGHADMLNNLLKNNFEDDRLEGMVDVALALIENNYPNEELIRYIAMSAYATGQFDVAKPYLGRLIEQQQLGDELSAMLQDYDNAQKDWQQEQELRAADAQGEALPRVLIKTTKGDIELELFENQAPETVANFIHLIEQGFYNHLTFHRVLQHFMAQGGCPNGDGLGDAGYSIYSEAHKPNARKFFRGTIGMALAESPDSGGSQFFVTLVPTPQLNEKFTAFGRVIRGMEVLSNLNRIDPENKDKNKPPVQPDEIREIEILSKRNHDYQPHKVQP